jgi:hypothetical protein
VSRISKPAPIWTVKRGVTPLEVETTLETIVQIGAASESKVKVFLES